MKVPRIQRIQISLLLSVLLLLQASAYAQRTDFSGTWLFRDQQSVSGNLIYNVSPTQMTVKQGKDALVIQKITSGGNVDVTVNETVGFDGQPLRTITPEGRKKINRIQWSGDQQQLTESEELFSAEDSTKLDYRVTDTWSLENGNLVMQRKDENLIIGELLESKLFYQKQ